MRNTLRAHDLDSAEGQRSTRPFQLLADPGTGVVTLSLRETLRTPRRGTQTLRSDGAKRGSSSVAHGGTRGTVRAFRSYARLPPSAPTIEAAFQNNSQAIFDMNPISENKRRLVLTAATLPVVLLCGCGGGGGGGGDGVAGQMSLVQVSNGFGLMLPHQTYRLDPATGLATSQLIPIRTQAELVDNVTSLNPILPVTEWPDAAILPNGVPGNHYIFAEFKQPIQVDSALDSSPTGQANSGLLGPITVIAVDPSSGQTVPVVGRAFIGGRTYAGTSSGVPPKLPLQRWVHYDKASGTLVADPVDEDGNPNTSPTFPGIGFPGVGQVGYPDAEKLVSKRTFVFVVDTNGDMSSSEKFNANRQIRLRATTALRGENGNSLIHQVLASGTVGPDILPPEVAVTPSPNSVPVSTPSFGDVDVDPQTTIRLSFTEPLQPFSVGAMPTGAITTLSSSITLQFGPSTQLTTVPFTVLPPSVYDLSIWELSPTFAFPGNGPVLQNCSTFNKVTVNITTQQIQDLKANRNTLPATTNFTTGEGPGLVNAPVVPDAIYVGRLGAEPGISVLDLNGFGQGTGNPSFDFSFNTFSEGNTNFPNNPNLRQWGSALFPPLLPGTCTVDGGSAGPFTLTKDSSLNDLLIRPPLLTLVGEMMIGQSLDLVFNNGKDTTGCRDGGGNFCSITGKKVVRSAFQTSQTVGPPQPNQVAAALVPGGANPVSFAPHPNPPPLIFPPLCLQPFIGGAEPTSIWNLQPPPPVGVGPALGPYTNLLAPGNPFGSTFSPPSGIPAQYQNCYFEGPDRNIYASPAPCLEYQFRQQVGHFLYMIDRARREILVLNSNRMTVLERISVPDPTDLAMGPQLDYLAVSNQSADSVSFIDINPNSSNFHKVIKTTPVGRGPRGLAWDGGNEDILVCNEEDNSVSIISAFSLNVRKVVKSHLNGPFDVAVGQRQNGYGFFRGVYFAFILNRNGTVALFESGPNGVNGYGYDDNIGIAPFTFANPRKIAMDFNNLNGSVFVLHENPLNVATGAPTGVSGGAFSRLDMDSGFFGILPLTGLNFFINPQLRDMSFGLRFSIGPEQLTGVPVDVALDDLNNLAATSNIFSQYSVGQPAQINGKSFVRPAVVPVRAKTPSFILLAVPTSSEGQGVIDVLSWTSGYIRVDTNGFDAGVQSVPCPGARYLCDYWRQ